jgi:hypothetical protein
MEAAKALQRFPGAQPIEGMRPLRNLPDGPEEWDRAGAGCGDGCRPRTTRVKAPEA